MENVFIEQHNHVRLQYYVNRLVREPERMSQLLLTAPTGNLIASKSSQPKTSRENCPSPLGGDGVRF
jgi:hypothetical protein